MIRDAINRILELAPPQFKEIHGRTYHVSNDGFQSMDPPRPDTLELNTLGGIVDFVKSNFIDAKRGCSIVINSPTDVRLVGSQDVAAKRPCYVKSTYKHAVYGLDREDADRMGVEECTILLQARFVHSAGVKDLLQLVGNMRAEKVKTSADDGFTQTVGQRVGAVMADRKEIKNPVLLAPFRTFPEIIQPESPFVFRVHQRADELPTCSLRVCDGGAWELQAIGLIKEYFKKELPELPVLA